MQFEKVKNGPAIFLRNIAYLVETGKKIYI